MMTMMGIVGLGGAGILLVAGVATLLLGKASASLRHLVWTAAFAALVAIPILEASGFRIEVAVPAQLLEALSDVKAEDESVAVEVAVADPSPSGTDVREGAAGQLVTASDVADGPLAAGLSAQTSNRLAGIGEWSVGRLAAGVWAVGFLFFLSVTLFSHLAARRVMVRNVRRCSTSTLRRFTALSVELGIKRPVRLVVSSKIRVPATWGFWRSTVVLPQEYGSWSRETLDRVLVHELAHVRRGDCLSYLVAELARAVHWPNPLMWLALYRARLESERACDDHVLTYGDTYGDSASAYAEDLVLMVRAFRAESRLPRAALAMADRTRVGGRVRAILDPKQARGRVGRLTMLVAGALTISLAAVTTVVTPIAVAQERPVGVQVVASLSRLQVDGEAWSQPELRFLGIQAPILLSPDRVVIADRGSSEAPFSDRRGDFLSRIGGPGDGSGELGFIRGMGLCGADALSVFELVARSYQSGDRPSGPYQLSCASSGDYVAVGWPE